MLDPRYLLVLTHACPSLRSSDLLISRLPGRIQPKDVGRRLDAKDVRYIGDNRKMSVVTSAAAFLLIGTQPEEIGVVHQNEPLVRTAQDQAERKSHRLNYSH